MVHASVPPRNCDIAVIKESLMQEFARHRDDLLIILKKMVGNVWLPERELHQLHHHHRHHQNKSFGLAMVGIAVIDLLKNVSVVKVMMMMMMMMVIQW